MEHSSVPLLDGQRGINSTLGSPRNFSKPFGSPASSPPPRDSPYVTLHDFLHAQHEALPLLDLSPNQAVRPLRRKSSRRDLSGDFLPATSHQASSRQLPRLRSPDSQALLIPLPPLPPSTPQQHPSAASPSLSSTITTLQSTPTQTPVAQPGLDLPPSIEPACRVLLEPLRVKRKFPGPKPPKRLPRRAGDGGWLVFANVIGDSESVDHLQGHVQSVSVPERPRGGLAARGRRPETESIEAKRDRSVRFAGIWSESDEGESTDRSAQGQEKDATGDSTYTLSKFKFPTPPGYAWSGTFGHLSEPTPPTSPATLHYRGASFDLVNPHASLLLGTKEFETPAEIDGLLDNYFDISQDSLDMQYDPITGNSIEQRGSTPSSEDGSRRGRPLYSDLSIARTNIMRIPSQPAASGQLDTGVPYQESPLAHRSPPHSRPTLVLAGDHSIEEGMSAMSVAGSAAQPLPPPQEPAGIGEQSRSRSRGASTTGAQSTYSDPFDLYLSESGFEQPLGQEYFDNIDRMVQSGQATRAGVLANEGGLTGRDVGADAEAYAFHTERDTTITNIVDHYGYRSAQDAQDETMSSIFVEQGRATAGEERRSTFMSNNPFLSANERRTAEASQRLRSPPGSPPRVPAPTPAPQSARGALQPDNTELPTSDQTYGATGELLGLTPAQIRRGPPATGNRDLEEAAIPQYIPRWDDDKENIPPMDEDVHATQEVHVTTHADGAFRPPIRIRRPDFADAMRANNFRAFPSSSSWLNAQDIYEDATADPLVAQGRARDRHAGHLAQPENGQATAAPHADNRRLDSGFDLEYPARLPAQASGTAPRIRDRDCLNALHNRAMERYESCGTVEDESEWVDEDEPFSRPNLYSQQIHDPDHRFSQVTQGSYADTSDYEDSRRGSFVPMPPPNAHELNNSPLPPGRFHRADWPGHKLGMRMPFSGPEPAPSPDDEFEMVEFVKDVIRQKYNEQRLTAGPVGLGESSRSETMRQNEATLETIRQTSRSTIRQAAAEVAAEAQEAQILQTHIPRIPRHLQPGGDDCDSFRHVMEAAVQEDIEDVARSTGPRHPYLTDERTPQRPTGQLAWSETEHTFRTVYPQSSPVIPSVPTHCLEPYSPLPGPPEPAFTRVRAGTEDPIRTGNNGYDELTPLTRSYPGKGRQRASVAGQTGLKPFLATMYDPALNAASSSPTVFNPGRRLTDSEMAKRVEFWQPCPSVEPRKAYNLIREPIPTSEEEGRRLLGVQQAHDPAAVRRHKVISGRLFNWCSLCPITALMFGFGFFDGIIANKMDGKVDGARQDDKHKALVVAAPASFVGWALVVLAVVLAVVFVRTVRAV